MGEPLIFDITDDNRDQFIARHGLRMISDVAATSCADAIYQRGMWTRGDVFELPVHCGGARTAVDSRFGAALRALVGAVTAMPVTW